MKDKDEAPPSDFIPRVLIMLVTLAILVIGGLVSFYKYSGVRELNEPIQTE